MYNLLKLLIFFISLLVVSCTSRHHPSGQEGARNIVPQGTNHGHKDADVLKGIVDPFALSPAPPKFPASTVDVALDLRHNLGLDYAAWVLASAESPEAEDLWASIRFALPSYGVVCMNTLLHSTMEGPISQSVVRDWATEVVLKAGSGVRSYGLWCSYSKCALVVESCPGTLELPKSLPGTVRGTLPPGPSYGIVFDGERGSLRTGQLRLEAQGRFEFLVPPCAPGMAFREFEIFQTDGAKAQPVFTGRFACGKRAYPRILNPSTLPRITDPVQASRIVFAMVNEFRSLKGLPPFRWNNRLARAAVLHSKALCSLHELYHTRPDGSTPEKRATEAGYTWQSVGENLAMATRVQTLVLSWYESYSHRSLLQNSTYVDAGVGICDQREDSYVYHYATLLAASPER